MSTRCTRKSLKERRQYDTNKNRQSTWTWTLNMRRNSKHNLCVRKEQIFRTFGRDIATNTKQTTPSLEMKQKQNLHSPERENAQNPEMGLRPRKTTEITNLRQHRQIWGAEKRTTHKNALEVFREKSTVFKLQTPECEREESVWVQVKVSCYRRTKIKRGTRERRTKGKAKEEGERDHVIVRLFYSVYIVLLLSLSVRKLGNPKAILSAILFFFFYHCSLPS